jgi:hypothetical protein
MVKTIIHDWKNAWWGLTAVVVWLRPLAAWEPAGLQPLMMKHIICE